MKNKVICAECKNLDMYHDGNHWFAHCNEPDKEIIFSPVTGNTIIKQYKLCVVKNKNANCKDFVQKPKWLHFQKIHLFGLLLLFLFLFLLVFYYIFDKIIK